MDKKSYLLSRSYTNKKGGGGGSGGTTNHQALSNLEFANSGHSGFQKELTSEQIANLEIIGNKVNYTDIWQLFKDVSYDGATGDLTFTTYNNAKKSVNLPFEMLVQSGAYNTTTKNIELVLASGGTILIPAGDLVDEYTADGNYIALNGNEFTLSASVIAQLNSIINKVEKVEGMGLSQANFTTEEKEKLGGIAINANNYSLPTSSETVKGGGTAVIATEEHTEDVAIDSSGRYKTKPSSGGGGSYTLPTANATTLGGVMAEAKTATDTVPVRIGTDKKLYVEAKGGGGGTAETTTYDNVESGLEATNVQGAIDEVNAKTGGGSSVLQIVVGTGSIPVNAWTEYESNTWKATIDLSYLGKNLSQYKPQVFFDRETAINAYYSNAIPESTVTGVDMYLVSEVAPNYIMTYEDIILTLVQ